MTQIACTMSRKSGAEKKTDPVQFEGPFKQGPFCFQKWAFCKQISPLRYKNYVEFDANGALFVAFGVQESAAYDCHPPFVLDAPSGWVNLNVCVCVFLCVLIFVCVSAYVYLCVCVCES